LGNARPPQHIFGRVYQLKPITRSRKTTPHRGSMTFCAALGWRLPFQRTNRFLPRRFRNQLFESSVSRFLLLGADDPKARGPVVPRWLRLKKAPSGFVGTESSCAGRIERRRTSLFVRISASLALGSGKRRQSGVRHLFLLRQLAHAPDVHRAPSASGLSRSEANSISIGVDAVAHPVNPAEAQCLIHRFGIGYGGPARFFLAEPDR